MKKQKILFLLDLDHTLIYGSFSEKETGELLFQHNKYLKVYKRDLAEDLIVQCKSKGHIIVYTTALRQYAKSICTKLNIEPIALLSRKNCKSVDGKHKKIINVEWLNNYDKIVIIDDSPNVWLAENDKIEFLVPDEFRGEADDKGLHKIIEIIKSY